MVLSLLAENSVVSNEAPVGAPLEVRTLRSKEIARRACPGLDPGAIRPYRTRRFHSWHCGIPESSVASLREVRPLEGNSYMNGVSLLQIGIPCQTLAYQFDKAILFCMA